MLKQMLKQALVRAGIEVRMNAFSDPLRLQQQLTTHTRSPVIFDIGAHIGLTYKAFRETFPEAFIHAVEPFEQSLIALREITASDPLCIVHDCALAKADEQRVLHINAASATNSLHATSDEAMNHWRTDKLAQQGTATVSARSLDSLCTEHAVSVIDVMKMDVQGGEYDLLQGSHRLLGEGAIRLLQMEYLVVDTYENQRPLQDFLTLLQSYDYRLIDMYQPLRRNGQLLQCDLMFASPAVPVL